MVGVPGRSKGCTTCRRRKVKCDEARPSCKRCAQSGRNCEGYEKFPVFLIRTVSGMEKRHALAETKPTFSPPRASEDLPGTGWMAVTRRHSAPVPNVLSSVDPGPVLARRIESVFLEDYLPSGSHSRVMGSWLITVVSRGERSRALEVSLKALTMARIGRAVGDNALVRSGNVAYGLALCKLQAALYDDRLARSDDTLAAGRALAFYELAESSSHSTSAWNSHEQGIARLIELRGPGTYEDDFARDIFLNVRYSAVWNTSHHQQFAYNLTDKKYPKSRKQELYDTGFELAAIGEDIDKAKDMPGDGQALITKVIDCVQRCVQLEDTLGLWYIDLVIEDLHPTKSHEDRTIVTDTMELTSLDESDNMALYWTMRMLVATTAAMLVKLVPSQVLQTHAWLNSIAARDCRAACMQFAKKIMESTSFMMRRTCRRFDSPDLLQKCQELYDELDAKKGWSFARDIAKKVDGW
ncbi:hypothetical protein MBLNU459_g5820t2 [Dothideomycetes sp. NU459]